MSQHKPDNAGSLNHAPEMTRDQLQIALNFAATKGKEAEKFCMILYLGRLCGLRIGEIAKLKVSDILHPNHTVKEQVTLTKHVTKGRRPRKAILNDFVMNELAGYLQHIRISDRALIGSQKGSHYTASSLTDKVNKFLEEAELYDVTSHSMRRGFITELLLANKPLPVVMEIVGHAQMSTTQRYARAPDTYKREAVALMNDV